MFAYVGIDVCPDVGDIGRTHVPRPLPTNLRATEEQRQDNYEGKKTFRSDETHLIYIDHRNQQATYDVFRTPKEKTTKIINFS